MSDTTTQPKLELLLIEDNSGDVLLTREAFEEINFQSNLHVVRDGEEALHFLRKEWRYEEAPTPDLIILDLNLPRKSGREVLAEIKEDKALKRIPVIVLSTSKSADDINMCYDLHVNCYLTKPVDFEAFLDIARGIEAFWVKLVKLPQVAG